MPYNTWIDDNNNTYSQPYVPKKIVGLHGIDPDLVGGSGGGGGVDDHEQLNNLLGGDNINGHWHMTQAEHEKLAELNTENPSVINDHELLGGLFGHGCERGNHYHLTHGQCAQLFELINRFLGEVSDWDTIWSYTDLIPLNQLNEIVKIFYPYDTVLHEWLPNSYALNLLQSQDNLNTIIDARIEAALTARGL